MAKRQIRRAQALRSFSGDSAPTLELTRPRQESNLRTRLRRPALSPLSYGGMWTKLYPTRAPLPKQTRVRAVYAPKRYTQGV